MSDANEIELHIWAEEIYARLVWWFTQLMNTGMTKEQAGDVLKPMVEYLSCLDAELVNA